MPRSSSRTLAAVALVATAAFPDDGQQVAARRHYEERPDDPPVARAAREDPLARSAAARPAKGAWVSVQINVDALGQNIVGDAANEPSIAVNRANPAQKVVGFRQFASVTSNFREAGWGYTVDGGQSWTFPGTLDPGVFRSDPVLDTDSAGNVFYQSLYQAGSLLPNDVWKSADGGQSWQAPSAAFGGDKNWMTVDKSGSAGDGHVYVSWQIAGACCGDRTFSRSVDGAASFQPPVRPARVPLFGTMAVGPDGEVWVAGIDGQSGQNFDVVVLARSADAPDPAGPPTFTGSAVDLGGSLAIGGTPNPQGLLGQINVAVDPSDGPTRGHVYVLASVERAAPGNPADVHLIRSEDDGQSWSAPLRVHGDPEHAGTWHWFGAIGVAPNGRVDAVWYDTRNSADARISEVFYAWSHDGGRSWSGDAPVTPPFDSTVGWPRQNKLGDYIQLVSDVEGADLAYAATFNGEQDVWYLRLFPDCNGNGVSDGRDVIDGASPNCNGDSVPDECEVDCDASGVPDVCETDCSGDCDADGDGCLDDADSAPGDPGACGDADADGCDDCSGGGGFDVAGDGPDADTDGVCDPGDCDPADNTIWRAPGPAALTLEHDRVRTRLAWQPPPDPGALALRYDLLRSGVARDFGRPAVCLLSDVEETATIESDLPAAGAAWYYLVRTGNDCPLGALLVTGSLGTDSAGRPRVGRPCPPTASAEGGASTRRARE